MMVHFAIVQNRYIHYLFVLKLVIIDPGLLKNLINILER